MKHNIAEDKGEDETSLTGLILVLGLYGFAAVPILLLIAAGF